MRIPELITEKFTLRSLRESDLDELVQICTDPETVRWTTVPLNYTRDDAQTFLTFTQRAAAAGRELTWAIDDSGVLAGAISLRLPEGSANAPGTYADLGFYTAAQMRGRGIMTDVSNQSILKSPSMLLKSSRSLDSSPTKSKQDSAGILEIASTKVGIG